jgi:oxygen-independent coproporphyrinogen-3 oxidase
MAGIYIHVPFCKQACHYCNFHFSTSLQYTNEFIQSIKKEIELKKIDLTREPIKTLYFGGGTPSILSNLQLDGLVLELKKMLDFSSIEEITIEVNPDDIDSNKLDFWLHSGINRLSIGTQSFRDIDLKLMNRAHDAKQAIESIKLARKSGFSNISIDLIYGIPGLSNEDWSNHLQEAIDLNIPHISSYCLTVEEKTALAHFINRKKIAKTNDEISNEQFGLMITILEKNDIFQYEISNFSKPGFESKHNRNYWIGEKYYGLGPGAHSFDGQNRYWNISNNQQYFKEIQSGKIPCEIEHLSIENRINEFIMTSLRTREGIDLKSLSNKFPEDLVNKVILSSNKWKKQSKIMESATHLYLSTEARFFADGIASDLFI